jgi:hypothetical protein
MCVWVEGEGISTPNLTSSHLPLNLIQLKSLNKSLEEQHTCLLTYADYTLAISLSTCTQTKHLSFALVF